MCFATSRGVVLHVLPQRCYRTARAFAKFLRMLSACFTTIATIKPPKTCRKETGGSESTHACAARDGCTHAYIPLICDQPTDSLLIDVVQHNPQGTQSVSNMNWRLRNLPLARDTMLTSTRCMNFGV